MNRFDIPQTVQDVIKVAIEENVIDAIGVFEIAYAMGADSSKDWNLLVDEIVECAFASRHCAGDKHVNVVKVAEKFWAYNRLIKNPGQLEGITIEPKATK